MIRAMAILALLVLAVVCGSGYFCNAWAAWAPPGEANPNHSNLVFASRFYGAMSLVCVATAIGVAVSGARRSAAPANPNSSFPIGPGL